MWIESPTNPLLGIADVRTLVAGAKQRGLEVAFDNTVATPLLQRPLEHGVDIVVHSATKLIGGHSDLLLGVAVCAEPDRRAPARAQNLAGSTPGTLESWLALRGVRTCTCASTAPKRTRTSWRDGSHPIPRSTASATRAWRTIRAIAGPASSCAASVRCWPSSHAAGPTGPTRSATTGVVGLGDQPGRIETLIERRAKWRGEELVPASAWLGSVSAASGVEDLWDDLEGALEATK